MANDSITKSLLNAFQTVVDKTIDQLQVDKTIKATIIRCISINDTEKKYCFSYNGGTAYAYCSSKESYEKGSLVYILVPEGNFSNKKMVIGLVDAADSDDDESWLNTSASLLDYKIIGSNPISEKIYSNTDNVNDTLKYSIYNGSTGLALHSAFTSDYRCVYMRDNSTEEKADNGKTNVGQDYDTYKYPVIEFDEETFSNTIKNSSAILISVDIYNNISESILKTTGGGNYGLVFNIEYYETEEKDDTKTRIVQYRLDTSEMTGDPYAYYSWNKQYMIFPIDSANYKQVDSIMVFSEDFVTVSTQNLSADEDIFFKDICIYGLGELTSYSGDYVMRMSTPDGNTFKTGDASEKLTIKSTVRYDKSEDITDSCTFYWGVKDSSITSSNEAYYSAYLGSGYKTLVKGEKGTNELTISASESTAFENEYICKVYYTNNDVILSDKITLFNNVNYYDINIEATPGKTFQLNEGKVSLKCVVEKDGIDKTALSYNWSVDGIQLNETYNSVVGQKAEALEVVQTTDENGNYNTYNGMTASQALVYFNQRLKQLKYVSYPKTVNSDEIEYDVAGIDYTATFSCSVYYCGSFIGDTSITITNSDEIINNDYYIDIVNGSQVFQYTENGVAPNSDIVANPIEVLNPYVVLYNPDGVEVSPKSITWKFPISNTLISPPTSGIEKNTVTGDYIYTGKEFPLDIINTYSSAAYNNQITAIVEYNDNVYKKDTSFFFCKIGDNGTNGTNTVLSIQSDLSIENELPTITHITNDASWNYGKSNAFESKLYTDNILNSGYETKWTIAGTSDKKSKFIKIIEDNNSQKVGISIDSKKDDDIEDISIIEAEVSYNSKKYYGYYNIPRIKHSDSTSYANNRIKILKNGTLDTILYDSNGTNPSYNKMLGVELSMDNSSNCTIDWGVKGGEDDNNPDITISATPNASSGTISIKHIDDINIEKIEDINNNVLSLIDEMPDSDIKNYLETIKNNLDINFINEEFDIETSVNNIKNILNELNDYYNSLNSDESNISTIYKFDIYQFYNNYNKIITEIEEEISLIKEENAIYSLFKDEIDNESSIDLMNIELIEYLLDENNEKISFETEELAKEYIETTKIKNTSLEEEVINENNSNWYIIINTLLQDKYNEYVKNIYYQNDGQYEDESEVVDTYSLNDITALFIKYITYIFKNNLQNIVDKISNNSVISKYQEIINKVETQLTQTDSKTNSTYYDTFLTSDIQSPVEIKEYFEDFYMQMCNEIKNIKLYQQQVSSDTFILFRNYLNNINSEMLMKVYVIPNASYNGKYCNNRVIATIQQNGVTIAEVTVPIHLMLNQYELSSINGWDGTHLEVNEDGEYILSPQIGAGVKDSTTNTFTGMVMGSISNNNDGYRSDKVGLVGYKNGKQSIFLDAQTGSATFGLPEEDGVYTEGRIELVPNGVSKIGNWKIGSRILYNVIGGDIERRRDADNRSTDSYKSLIPHDKYGIILSADKPYIHVKGENFSEEDSGIDYIDEKNTVNPGDGLEVRIDPNNSSLFSIIQHTAGLGQQTLSEIEFGYLNKNGDNEKEIHDLSETINATSIDDYSNYDFIAYYKTNDNWRTLTSDIINSTSNINGSISLEFPKNVIIFDNDELLVTDENENKKDNCEYGIINTEDEGDGYIYETQTGTYSKSYKTNNQIFSFNLKENNDFEINKTEVGFNLNLNIDSNDNNYSFSQDDYIVFKLYKEGNDKYIGISKKNNINDIESYFITFYTNEDYEKLYEIETGVNYLIYMEINYTYEVSQEKTICTINNVTSQ